MVKASEGNPHRATCWEWWQYEVEARARVFAREAAERGANGEFGVYPNDLPTPEGGEYVPGGLVDRGPFVLVACKRTDWLAGVEVLRWEERPGLWQFNEWMGTGIGATDWTGDEATPRVGLFAKLDMMLQRAVNRVAFEANGLCAWVRLGFCIRAGQLTIGFKIDALQPFGAADVGWGKL